MAGNSLELAAIIPARGGSKGIPGKNIRLLNGKPLLTYTIESALESRVAKDVFVSTDSEEIMRVAEASGASVINRPPEISHDTASTESALLHGVDFIKANHGWNPEYILTLPPTSPLRKAETIRKFISSFIPVCNEYDAMLSFTECRGDYWIKANEDFSRLFPDAPRRRQDRKPLYLENSAMYVTKTESLIVTGSILGRNCTGFVINEIEAIDINEPLDLQWAEFVLKNIL
jgi:CMP-N-acetylneuraminic acid synthetase